MRIENEELLNEFRWQGYCDLCRRRVAPVHAHHVKARGMGGGSRLDVRENILGACPPCHNDCHNGKISRQRQLEVIAQREELTPAQVEQRIWDLLREPKTA